MRKLIRLEEPRVVRPAQLVTAAAGVAVVVAGGAGIVTRQGRAATASNACKSSTKVEKFKQPKLKHGLVTIEGTNGNDRIALPSQAGRPDVLRVDVGDDGSADFTFRRAETRDAPVALVAG